MRKSKLLQQAVWSGLSWMVIGLIASTHIDAKSFYSSALSTFSSYGSSSTNASVPVEPPVKSCSVPDLRPPRLSDIDCQNNSRPDSYVMALSWSPQYCANTNPDSRSAKMQCQANHFGFVVHGLWPQIMRAGSSKCGQPRHCGGGEVDNDTMLKTICVMPGTQLIQDEWQKHGSCSGLSIPQYFAQVRKLNAQLNKPDLTAMVQQQGAMTAGDIANAFVAVNQQAKLPRSAVVVRVGSRNSFQELLVCYDLNFNFTSCQMRGTPDTQRVWVQKQAK